MTDPMNLLKFPPDLLIGFSSSSYQIEGAWDSDGKGESIWDRFTHTQSSRIADKSNGDIAANSYKLYKEDIAMMKEIGGQVYRFSISWPRLLPNGFSNEINSAGLTYYNNVIDELLANGIEPMITLFHWDLPQTLQDLGGWTNELIVKYFADYARIVFANFGDRVKKWITFNEPWEITYFGYGLGAFAPGVTGKGVAEYLAAHNILKAHATAYHIYHDEFQPGQKGLVGIAFNTAFQEPKNADNPYDVLAAKRSFDFNVGWFAHPIYSSEGDYPESLKKIIAANSQEEGFSISRLPEFNKHWISFIRGSADFFGVNHYTTSLVSDVSKPPGMEPSWRKDLSVEHSSDPSWSTAASFWLKVVPYGLRKALNQIKTEYNNPLIFITENGFSDKGEIEDDARISYFDAYLKEVLKAVYQDGINVKIYTAWSLLDNFEWLSGYSERFGIIHVDFSDPEKKRKFKKSANYFKKILQARSLE